MKKATALLLTVILVLPLAACGAQRSAYQSLPGEVAVGAPEMDNMESGASSTDTIQPEVTVPGEEIYADPDAKIIRTAEVTIQTLEFDQAVAQLAALTEANGGYYETAQVDSGSYFSSAPRRTAYYVVRIPRENFNAFRDGAEGVGHVYSYVENSRNVSESYYDTEARLETLEIKRERLLALLEQAEAMEDIISLENALSDVQYEIDQYTTTLRKYDSLIGYSTFTVHLDEVTRIQEEPGVQEGFGARLLASLQQGLADFGAGVESAVLWLARNLIALVLLAAIIAVAVVLAVRARRKRRTKKAAVREEKQP